VLYQLVYTSTALRPWSRPELLGLLRQARANNARQDITGVLLLRGSGFVQLLEGTRDRVEPLYATIAADPRHARVTLVWDADASARWFPGWSMGFRDLEDDPVTEPGLTDVLRGPAEATAFSHEVVLQLWSMLRPPGPPPGPARGTGPGEPG